MYSMLTNVANLGANDIYTWYLASVRSSDTSPPDVKINLIYPCTETHIKKYSPQQFRMVTETPEIYNQLVRPYMRRKRDEGRLNWVFNIIENRAEQDDIVYRESAKLGQDLLGFLIIPDMNWDRKTISSLRLLCLVERRDIWSLRDFKKEHVPWLKLMRGKILAAVSRMYPDVEQDMIKLYLHYQPTYYHLHIHITHVQLEANATQVVGKAFGLENLIAQLEGMPDDPSLSLASTNITYSVGEASELWTDIFLPLKEKMS
ncbi:hypothetical protein MMC25_005512 [Agyrium rufum]|nr:hypothetical protein [Agyrium rufum]